MMSTSLGTPPYPNFLLNFERISFRETDWLASCALISSAAIPEVTRRSISAWDGPNGIQGLSASFNSSYGTNLPSVFVRWTILTVRCKFLSFRGDPSCGELQVRIASRFLFRRLGFWFSHGVWFSADQEKGNGDVDEVIISVLIRQRSPRASDP